MVLSQKDLNRINLSKKFKKFLKKVEKTGEYTLKGTLFKGIAYIDSPGFFQNEKDLYNNDIIYFYEQHAKLEDFWKFFKKYPERVTKFLKNA